MKTILPLLATCIAALTGPVSAQTPKCSSEEKSHQFDFWIGEWNVTAGGQQAGTNSIVAILDGCVLQENWTGTSGSAGSSFNYYDPQKDQWEQFWVWRNGTTLYNVGHYEDGKMVLSGESEDRNGNAVKNRITWYDNDDGTVRQHWEVSSDDGETWSTAFDGLYKRKNL